MIFYFTDIADIMVLSDPYIHDPMTDRENCGLIIGTSAGDEVRIWITEDAFEYLREGILSGKTTFLLDPTEGIHNGIDEATVYDIVKDD